MAEVLGKRDDHADVREDIRFSCGRFHRSVQRVMTSQVKKEDEMVVVLRILQDLLFQSYALESGIDPSIQE